MRLTRWWRAVRRPGAFAVAAFALAAATIAGPGAPVALAANEPLSGQGSSWSANAMQQWTSDESSKGVTVNFASNSSGAGRQAFAFYQADFANSDIPYQGKDPLTGQLDTSNRKFAYMPIIAGGTSLMYQLYQGSTRIENVRLSGQTIAEIFTGKITMWNDPAITADMNGHALPAKRIQVVVASGGSGTTAQFTDWMSKRYPSIWTSYAGADEPTSYYPINAPNITAQGNDSSIAGAIAASGSGDGSIGYVQYSYALNSHFPVVNVLNAAGYYVGPTPYNVAVALMQAQIDTTDVNDPTKYLTQQLGGVYVNSDQRSYPLSSYSYMIIPTDPNDNRIDAGKAATFADFSYYFLCEGQQEAPQLGYSPLPLNLVRAGFQQVTRFSHIQPQDLQNKDATTCDNPTFDPNNPNANRLAEIDPAPPLCDKQGQGPCGDTSGSSGGGGSGGGGSGGGNGSAGGGGAGSGAGAGNGSGGANGGVNPETGLPAGADAGGANGESAAQLAAFRSQGSTTVMGVLAAIEVVLVLLVPAFVARAINRRRARGEEGS